MTLLRSSLVLGLGLTLAACGDKDGGGDSGTADTDGTDTDTDTDGGDTDTDTDGGGDTGETGGDTGETGGDTGGSGGTGAAALWFSDYGGVKRIDLDTMEETVVSDATISIPMVGAPGGGAIAHADGFSTSNLEITSADGTELVSTTATGYAIGWADAETALFQAQEATYVAATSISAMSLDGTVTELYDISEMGGVVNSSVSHDGTQVAVTNADFYGDDYTVVFDVDDPSGAVSLPFSAGYAYPEPFWTRDGAVMWVSGSSLFVSDPAGSPVEEIVLDQSLTALGDAWVDDGTLVGSWEETGDGGLRISHVVTVAKDGTLTDIDWLTERNVLVERIQTTPDGTVFWYEGTTVYMAASDGSGITEIASGSAGIQLLTL